MIYILASIFILLSIYLSLVNKTYIEEDKVITKKSINGKILSSSTTYYLVKRTWLLKYYIWFSPYDLLHRTYSIQVSLRKYKSGGTEFSTKEEAQEILDDMKQNPDRYYIYL